jgi:hypothetical protein
MATPGHLPPASRRKRGAVAGCYLVLTPIKSAPHCCGHWHQQGPGASRRPVADTLAWLEPDRVRSLVGGRQPPSVVEPSDLLLPKAGQAHPTRQGHKDKTKTGQVALLLEAGAGRSVRPPGPVPRTVGAGGDVPTRSLASDAAV